MADTSSQRLSESDGQLIAGRLRLDSLVAGDHARLRAWLSLPIVSAWWGTRDRAEAEIALARDSPSALCRMVRVDGDPVGYAQAIDAALLDSRASGDAEGEIGSWECAAFIASEPHRGQGFGAAALGALVGEVFATTLAISCILRVPIGNETAVRAVERIGFRWVRVAHDVGLGRIWLMRCERPGMPTLPLCARS